jgi:F-type H+-transporting ATPase subunit gamma
MKNLAAVNIRQYEGAVESLEEHKHIVDMGWQVLLRHGESIPSNRKALDTVCVLFGSDQGMCGQFNEVLLAYAQEHIKEQIGKGAEIIYWSVGEKLRNNLLDARQTIAEHFRAAESLTAISALVHTMVLKIDTYYSSQKAERFFIFHNRVTEGAGYAQNSYRVLPLDQAWSAEYKARKWPGRCLPSLGIPYPEMFRHLFAQHLFISLYKAMAQSLASENAARLMSMQAAEKNIIEMQEQLQGKYREQRQNLITNELLDIISGFEALSDEMTPI